MTLETRDTTTKQKATTTAKRKTFFTFMVEKRIKTSLNEEKDKCAELFAKEEVWTQGLFTTKFITSMLLISTKRFADIRTHKEIIH